MPKTDQSKHKQKIKSKMDNQKIIALKQKLSSLEPQEKTLTSEMQSAKSKRNSGMALTFIGLVIGSGIWSSYNDLGGLLILIGTPIGIILWVSGSMKSGKKKKELEAVTNDITITKNEIIKEEHS